MRLQAIIFGAGALTDRHELEREAYNRVFAEAGLSWFWGPSDYERLTRLSAHGDVLDAYIRSDRPTWRFTEDVQHMLRAARRRHAAICQDLAGDIRFTDHAMSTLASTAAWAGFKVGVIGISGRSANSDTVIEPANHAQALDILQLSGAACLAIECTPGGFAQAREAGMAAVDRAAALAALRGAGPIDASQSATILRNLHAQAQPYLDIRSLALFA